MAAFLGGLFRLLGLVAVAAGLAAAGLLVGEGIKAPRVDDRYVTVKGLAERDVRADLALWPLRFVVTGDDLGELKQGVAAAEAAIRKFLADGGLDPAQAEAKGLEVTDAYAQLYRQGSIQARYSATETLQLRTAEVDKVAALAQRSGDLVAAGVVLSSEGMGSGPVYIFTRLNESKPDMIADADREARLAAEQFAKDSGAVLGGIRQATQGLFQILPRDDTPGVSEPARLEKRLRVVATVQYYLRDGAAAAGGGPLSALRTYLGS